MPLFPQKDGGGACLHAFSSSAHLTFFCMLRAARMLGICRASVITFCSSSVPKRLFASAIHADLHVSRLFFTARRKKLIEPISNQSTQVSGRILPSNLIVCPYTLIFSMTLFFSCIDGDGILTPEELIDHFRSLGMQIHEEVIISNSAHERQMTCRKIFQNVPTQACRFLFEDVDANGDGKLQFEEFVVMVFQCNADMEKLKNPVG